MKLILRIFNKIKDLIFYPFKQWRIYRWKLYQHSNQKLIKFKRQKYKWTVFNYDQNIAFNLFVYGSWQFREIDLVVEKLNLNNSNHNNKFIVNVGANIGTSAIYLAKKTNYKVLAIEPVPEIFKILNENVKSNDLESRIICFQAAVYSQVNDLKMVTPKSNPGGSEIYLGNPSFLSENLNESFQVSNAAALPLEDILRANNIDAQDVILVWSDAQGSEGHIIRTGLSLWKNKVPLVMEFWPHGLKTQGENDICSLIKSNFKAFAKLPFYFDELADLTELPVESLDLNIISNKRGKDDVDLLLLP